MHVSVLGTTIELDGTAVAEPEAEIRRQLAAYERGERRTFELTVEEPPGLTGEVMAAMAEISYGESRTYGELADELDTAPVAVGGACGRNPVPVVVPCHRVVGHDGGLRGYSTAGGVATKRALLEFEARRSDPAQSRFPWSPPEE